LKILGATTSRSCLKKLELREEALEALFEELSLEVTMDLSQDRLRNEGEKSFEFFTHTITLHILSFGILFCNPGTKGRGL
jgi:hypothetical protein